ncbi:MAG: hypothetical protein ACQEVA_12535 [Myxococcota bacterium]
MEWPAGAVWMVGIGVVGLAGTGAVYYIDQMPDSPAESSAFDDPIDPPDFLDKEPKSAPDEPEAKVGDEPEPESDQCRALVNVRVGGTDRGLYNYRVLDVRFQSDGRIRTEFGPGLAVQTVDGIYSLQGHIEDTDGVPQHNVVAFSHDEEGPADTSLWRHPEIQDGLQENRGFGTWPVYRQYTRVRSTIDPYVSLHREVVNSEGGMRDESGSVRDVRSGEKAHPLRLNMSAIEGRAAAFSHERSATYEGSESIWEAFENRGEGDFLLRLANGPGKSIQPEAGVCCYEREGASQVVFARLDRGAFALMAPGYLSRSDGLVRAGDGCGEFGWDGGTVYARRRNAGGWTPIDVSSGQTVQEFLGAYWIPMDSGFSTASQPAPPELPSQDEMMRVAENAGKLGRQAFDSGNNQTAVQQLRKAIRIKMLLGQSVDALQPTYDKAVARSGERDEAARYLRTRIRFAGPESQKRQLEQLADENGIQLEPSPDTPEPGLR